MRIDFNNSINSANIPIINDQKVTVKDAKDAWDYNIVVSCADSERMFKTFTTFCKFPKSLIPGVLWICCFCDFASYLGFGLYYGCRGFSSLLEPQDLQKKTSIGCDSRKNLAKRKKEGNNLFSC